MKEVCVCIATTTAATPHVCDMGSYRSAGWHIKSQKNLVSARSLSPLGHDVQYRTVSSSNPSVYQRAAQPYSSIRNRSIMDQVRWVLPSQTAETADGRGYCYEDRERWCLARAHRCDWAAGQISTGDVIFTYYRQLQLAVPEIQGIRNISA